MDLSYVWAMVLMLPLIEAWKAEVNLVALLQYESLECLCVNYQYPCHGEVDETGLQHRCGQQRK
jgi:hypothetical protein